VITDSNVGASLQDLNCYADLLLSTGTWAEIHV